MNILAGYEIGTGNPVSIPAAHMAITGQTQRSGKTTAMESIVERSGMKAVAFITKRGESAFQFGHETQPYFRERADWMFVKSLFEQLTNASQGDKEAEIIRLCDGAKSLEHVWQRVQKAMDGKHSKRKDDMYIRINAYFHELMPKLEQVPRSKRLELKRGINVIDMRDYEHSVQEILIQNAFQWVYEKEENTIFVVPEAWDFLSEEHGSITRTAGREFVRRAAALHNFLWADCQDIRGLDKQILGMMGIWLVGNQREMNEMARTIKSFPSLPAPPSVTEIMTLGIGEFFVLHGTESRKVYVQPVWADAHACAMYAKNRGADGKPRMPLPKMPPPPKRPRTEITLEEQAHEDAKEMEAHHIGGMEKPVSGAETTRGSQRNTAGDRSSDVHPTDLRHLQRGDACRSGSPQAVDAVQSSAETAALRAEIKEIRASVETLGQRITEVLNTRQMSALSASEQAILRDEEARSTFKGGTMGKTDTKPATGFNAGDEAQYEAIYQWMRARARRDPDIIAMLVTKPELRISVARPVLELDESSIIGRIGILITKKFFDTPKTSQDVFRELVRIGHISAKAVKLGGKVGQDVSKLASLGFLTYETDGYQSVPDMKIRTVEA
jgi:hypothetical protein